MAIRIRTVTGTDGRPIRVALCAARSTPQPGDLYLDDGDHHALSAKFDLDLASQYGFRAAYAGTEHERTMEREESDNPNRDDWERTFGGAAAAGEGRADG